MTEGVVLKIKCDLKSFYCKRRFPITEWTVADFRLYIEQLLDISTENLIIRLHSRELTTDRNNDVLCNVTEFVENDTILIDSHRHADDIDNINRLPQKYRMSDEVYAKRQGTLKDYLQRNKLGKYRDQTPSISFFSQNNNEKKRQLRELNRSKLQKLQIGMKVAVTEPMLKRRDGEVVYIGLLRGICDEFIGVIFDGPVGDSNGCDGTIRYFDAQRKYASFVRPEFIEIICDDSNEAKNLS